MNEIEQAQAIARIETVVNDMHTRLFGNGQPGIVREYDTRIAGLEKDRSSFMGVVKFLKYAATVGPLLVAVTEFVIHKWILQ